MKLQKPQKLPPKTSKIAKQQKPLKKKQLSIQELIKKDKNFEYTPNGKIRCKLTNHEMAATVANYQNYINSKSYKRGLEKQYDIGQYELILVDFKGDPRFYYCQITGAKVAKKKSAVEKHINGKRFKAAYEELKKQEDQEYASEQGSAPLEELQKLANEESQQQQQQQSQQKQEVVTPPPTKKPSKPSKPQKK